MNSQFQWEDHLLPLALKALDQENPEVPYRLSSPLLAEAYRRCEQITRENSKTFYMASGLLPPEKRNAVRALYAFCRVTDDIVDRGGGNAGSQLKTWEKQALHPLHNHHIENMDTPTLVALAWQDARQACHVPVLYARQLVGGVAYDLLKNRYDTFNELAAYCYGVACTVGLMSMYIVGHSGPEAIPYAIRLGGALQLTNILRDVGEDWRMGRLYLPKEELEAFGLNEDDIARGIVTEKWRTFMRFQIERVRVLYASAMPGIAMLHPDGRFAIGAAAELYEAILEEIEKNDYDVFSRRAVVSTSGKLRRLPGIWWRARTGRYPERNLPTGISSPQLI